MSLLIKQPSSKEPVFHHRSPEVYLENTTSCQLQFHLGVKHLISLGRLLRKYFKVVLILEHNYFIYTYDSLHKYKVLSLINDYYICFPYHAFICPFGGVFKVSIFFIHTKTALRHINWSKCYSHSKKYILLKIKQKNHFHYKKNILVYFLLKFIILQ